MLKKYSTIFSKLMVGLFDLEMAHFSPDPNADEAKAPLSKKDVESLEYFLLVSRNMADELQLDSVPPLLDRMDRKVSSGVYSSVEAAHDMGNLRSRIEDQLRSRFFLFVAPNRVAYYQDPQQFGPEVEARFPTAIDDIEDAAKCLSLGQGTACVLHLMRVMEEGLKALSKLLGIPYAPSWESHLKQIQDRIDAKHRTKKVRWKRDEKKFRDLSGDLLTVKQAWRNPTMHVDRRYSPDEAEEILRAVRTFMKNLAERLPQLSSQKSS